MGGLSRPGLLERPERLGGLGYIDLGRWVPAGGEGVDLGLHHPGPGFWGQIFGFNDRVFGSPKPYTHARAYISTFARETIVKESSPRSGDRVETGWDEAVRTGGLGEKCEAVSLRSGDRIDRCECKADRAGWEKGFPPE
jgi:hypothetical protein